MNLSKESLDNEFNNYNPYDKFIADAAREYMEIYYKSILKNLQIDDELIKAWTKLQNMIQAEDEGKNPQEVIGNKEESA